MILKDIVGKPGTKFYFQADMIEDATIKISYIVLIGESISYRLSKYYVIARLETGHVVTLTDEDEKLLNHVVVEIL